MTNLMRSVLGGLALVLLVLMAVLFWRGPHFKTSGTGDPTVHVSCGSIAAVGWPSDHSSLNSSSDAEYGDHTDLPEMGSKDADPALLGIANDCSQRRDTYLGLMSFMGPLAALLAAGAFFGGPRRREELPVAGV